MIQLSLGELEKINKDLEPKTAQEVLKWAVSRFPKIALASSFGAEDVVLIDLVVKAAPQIKIFTLDTGRLNEETYEVAERIREKYGIDIEVYFPDKAAVEELETKKGFYSFRKSIEDRRFCCTVRKIEPLRRELSKLDAWVTGLRREQAPTRTDITKIEIDKGNGGIIKVNPLADWKESQVWDYIKANKVPYNKLHDQNFPSIGCSPCTRAVKPGEDIRAGRWWWENPEQKECGLHAHKK